MPIPDPRQVAARTTRPPSHPSQTPARESGHLVVPTSTEPCPLPADAATTLAVAPAAVNAYRAAHPGTSPNHVEEALRSMVGDLIALGRWELRFGDRLHLAAHGYQVVISADLATIRSYRTSQPHRTWAQTRTGVSSSYRARHRRAYLDRRQARRYHALTRAGLTVTTRRRGGRSTTVTTRDGRSTQAQGNTLRNLSVAQWDDLVSRIATDLGVTVRLDS
ncbi:hypothetical protein ACFVWN_20450 [Nocardiopsis flavescens]|uniref:hypothetical protein n=1 Tax=Nocardiopsis flavescens TaxID=758803 RepID=UPI0036607A63